MQIADGYLMAPMLSLPPIEEYSSLSKNDKYMPNMSVMSGTSTTKDFLQQNKD